MFIKSRLLIHTKEKKNVRYVAAGNYQIEFFSLTGKEYFGIYSPYGGDNFCLCLPLGDVSIATIEHGYQIHHGALTYKVLMRRQRRGHEFALHRLLWGGFPPVTEGALFLPTASTWFTVISNPLSTALRHNSYHDY